MISKLVKFAKRKAIEPVAPFLLHRYFSKCTGDKPYVSITFDCDLPEDIKAIPQVLDVLASYNVKTSFACVGMWMEKNKRAHQRILDEGHEIVNHTVTHPNNFQYNTRKFHELTLKEKENEVADFDKLCKKLFGYKPIGFRSPHFGDQHTLDVYPLLEKHGYLYSSSTIVTHTKGYGMPYFPSRTNFLIPGKTKKESFPLLEVPNMVCPKHYLALFDTWHCFRSPYPAHPRKEDFFTLFKESLRYVQKYNVLSVYYFDPQDLIDLKSFENSLEYLSELNIPSGTMEKAVRQLLKKKTG